MRVLQVLGPFWHVLALTSSPERCAVLRQAGAQPLLGNLDEPATLGRLGRLADAVLHLAPPQASGRRDLRTQALLQALGRGGRVRRLVYCSTTGVYGDCEGDWVDETHPVHPTTERAWRRADAEAQVRHWGRALGCATTVLRVPGIYASNRPGGHPRERLLKGLPALRASDDVYTNHIHADDLARACVAALMRGKPQRMVNVVDNSEMRMGDYFDLAADLCGLPRPPRIPRDEAQTVLPTMMMSFMSESRRLHNRRLKDELRLRLRYPTVREGLSSG
jgi:nucleoside-diphosphate-sugar epimerase